MEWIEDKSKMPDNKNDSISVVYMLYCVYVPGVLHNILVSSNI